MLVATLRHRADKQPERSREVVVVLSCDRFSRAQSSETRATTGKRIHYPSIPAIALHQNQFPGSCTSHLVIPIGPEMHGRFV